MTTTHEQQGIAEYQAALQGCSQACTRVHSVVDPMLRNAAMLKDWQKDRIQNISVLEPGGLHLRTSIIDGTKWPTVEDVAQALADWHQARSALDNAWRRVPHDQRSGVCWPTRRECLRNQPPFYCVEKIEWWCFVQGLARDDYQSLAGLGVSPL